ncbi:GlxA family transcriptional regulator [Pectobacterium brasiliense]|uniref:Helix-turn-helix domain-containing protein n=1 Tax=Pectobacterium brasiliense TaxID=180957 RepID=A0A3S0Y7R8_9GAMM|nr:MULTISPECIES: helix-turn-helix domain-containing protein [Pectobacterium]GKW27506.1 AraC family transcriptional regulator [Pectobacterium carotovorum subsp. carotovorum]KFF62655.1 AraC family transcriptional regulator [Pectobacterium brasiliense]MBN3048981.1 helix-turn-helix domain-containing protein [Pectobacterium brasiliense]MBN3077292.1 helix-turn-helix domain-containing protein [Pectobacterium brasiliense]MBN3085034.1 helix-turn-helix domain-containing protein [Pectobacterium brasilien
MAVLTVAVVVSENFSPFHLSIPSMVFSDMLYEEKQFEIFFCAEKPGMVASEHGFSINVEHGFSALEKADLIVVPHWSHPETRPSAPLLDALRIAEARKAQIAGLCLGTYVLAYAGLLDGRRASTHWAFEQDFIARFLHVQLDTNALYVEDEHLITSAGTVAAIDCCLYLVRQHCGSAIANRAARRLVIPPYREGGQAQFIEHPVPENTRDSKINQLLDYLRSHLSSPHSLDALASRVQMSRRTFTRHFFRATGMTVSDWLTAERLHHSQALLESTSHSIEAIADNVGFQSVVTFRQQFKQRFSVSPTDWRKTFQDKSCVR